MIALITGIIGLIATLAAWFLNPRRLVYAELDGIYVYLDKLYLRRDKALQNNDSNELTIVTQEIEKLATRKAVLIKRLG